MLPLSKILIVAAVSVASNGHADQIRSATESLSNFERYQAQHGEAYQEIILEQIERNNAYRAENSEAALTSARETIKNSPWSEMAKMGRTESMERFGSVVGSIPNPEMASAEGIRRFERGLEKDDQLYVFVSRSMPVELIQSYALEAAYAGGVLVVRGIKNNETLNDFLTGQLVNTLKPEGKGAMIQIDPRLFDAFNIQTVPSIVYTGRSISDLCSNGTPTKCDPLPAETYFKISGSVTILFALEQFALHGADGARRFKSAMAEGYRVGSADNPNLTTGITESKYREKLAQLEASTVINNENYLNGTHIPIREVRNTVFGQIEMPIGTQMLLESIGGIRAKQQGVSK